MKVARTRCVVVSPFRSAVARGVAPVVAAPKAVTMIDKEKVVTVSIEVAMIVRIASTALAPIRAARPSGRTGRRKPAPSDVATPRRP